MKHHAGVEQLEMPGLRLEGDELSDSAMYSRWQLLRAPEPFAPALEADYARDHLARMQPIRRAATALALLVWGALAIADLFIADHSPAYRAVSMWLTAIRLLTLLAIVAIVIRFLTDRRLREAPGHADKLMLAAAALYFTSLCMITALVPAPFDRLHFYNGMLVAIAASFVLLCLRGREAGMLAGMHAVGALLTVLWCQYGKAVPTDALQETPLFPLDTILLFGTSILVCHAGSLLMEAHSRRNFIGRKVLAIQREALAWHAREMARLELELERSSEEAASRTRVLTELKERLRDEGLQRNRDKSQFIASAVHDLRQPVQAVMTALYPVQKALDQGDRRTVDELLAISSQAVTSLNDQLQAILDLSRLESGTFRPELAIVDLRRELTEVFDSWKGAGARDKVSLELNLPSASQRAVARTDPGFLRRVVSNLISNGIKFAAPARPEGQRVTLSLRVCGERLAVEVRDNGLGMEQTLVDTGQIFQPFFQINNTQAQGCKGVGLGLAVVRALVSLLPDHKLSVRSSPGKGSLFVLEIPCFDEADLPVITCEAAQALDLGSLAGAYVVLVEDDELVRRATAHLLGVIGVLCDAHASFDEFEQSLDSMERLPDVVLSDFRLPDGRSALDVGRALREHDVAVPLVVFSGEVMDLCMLEGLVDVPVLSKPLTVEKLVRTLRGVARPFEPVLSDIG